MPRKRQTIEWIVSSDCDWPMMVKRLSVQIIRQRAELATMQERFVAVNMLAPEKVDLAEQVAELTQKLANSYRNLSKELAYHRSRTNHSNYPR